MLDKDRLGEKQRQVLRKQKRKSKGGETPKFIFHDTLQGQRISTSMRLKRIREMIVAGAPYSFVASQAGIPENRIPRIIVEIRRRDKAELPSRLARRDELRRMAASGVRMQKWEKNQLKHLENPYTLELPDKRTADAARLKEYRKRYEKCKGCGRERAIGKNCVWHDCPLHNEFIIV